MLHEESSLLPSLLIYEDKLTMVKCFRRNLTNHRANFHTHADQAAWKVRPTDQLFN